MRLVTTSVQHVLQKRTCSVWYVFWLTPQHMPLLLFAMMPPTMALSMLPGSGPILYCTGVLCFLWWCAKI